MKAVSTKMVAIVMTPEPKELTPSSNNIMNGHDMIKIVTHQVSICITYKLKLM